MTQDNRMLNDPFGPNVKYVARNRCTRPHCNGQYILTDSPGREHHVGLTEVLRLVDAMTGDEGFLRHIFICVNKQCKACAYLDKELIQRRLNPIDWRMTLPIECLLCGWAPGGEAGAALRLALYTGAPVVYCRNGKHLKTPENTVVWSDGHERCRDCIRDRNKTEVKNTKVLVRGVQHTTTLVNTGGR